ncbi:MAG TPA: hypothetical protein PKC84_16095 [Paracoccaceae bacterium]|nr:hypothetical protein [Paracoccaceae bacterium]
MAVHRTVREIIDLWPTRRDLARDVGTTEARVHRWAARNSIPARFHAGVLRAGRLRAFGVTADELVAAHDGVAEDAA